MGNLIEDIYGNKIMRSMDKVKEEACAHGRTEGKHRSFLTSLQLEYLTHKLRSVIYQNQTYASVAADIAAKKRAKIEELSAKFHVDTIFTPGYDVSEFIEKNFWQPYGLPLFQYKDDEQRRVQGNYDNWYFFFRGTKVVYKGKLGIVLKNDPPQKTLVILVGKNKFNVSYFEVSVEMNLKLWL